MISEQTFSTFPLFGDNATKVEPDDNKKSNGWQQADVVPAEWMNWEWYHASKGVSDLNSGVASMEREILSVLSDANIIPAEATDNQLLTALNKIRPMFGTCETAAATAAKSASITSAVLKAGSVYVITMTYANTASSPTLSINSGTAYPMCNASGEALVSGAWEAGDMIKVLFTGSKYLMATAVTDKVESGNQKAVTSNSMSCRMTANTTVTGPALGVGGIVRVMFTADITGSDTTTGLTLSYNGTSIAVMVNKYGVKTALYAHEVSTDVFKYIQAYTTLEFVYDGTDFIIVGNPVVLSSSDYTIYADGFNEKEYTRNQNILSDWEKITISTDSNNPTEIQYDGFITVHNTVGTSAFRFYVNGVEITSEGATSNSPRGHTLPLKKGDSVYTTGVAQESTAYFLASFYKLRDYTDR